LARLRQAARKAILGPAGSKVGLQVPSHFETISIFASSTLLIHGYSTEIFFVSGFNPSGPIRFVFVTWGSFYQIRLKTKNLGVPQLGGLNVILTIW